MHQARIDSRVVETVPIAGHAAGRGPDWEEIRQFIHVAAACRASVLISGGNRRVRESLARLIHQESALRDAPFVVVDSRSTSNRCLESPSPGSLFIEQAHDLSSTMQAPLLDLLERQARRPPDVTRVMAGATHALFVKVRSGTFSSDLFYRLNIIHLVIRPRRHRFQG
jgi:DNA-binding NtrC family response regulator